ncbi:CsbD family protein [Streptomyces caatingaensis]|uniref:CsbD family protein n=1 Tax=Streptomyces caatingaensis TaxID=1678637 RepID=UPI00099BE8D8|nr:CsbD family protein [Streptomyces caatingaensis]
MGKAQHKAKQAKGRLKETAGKLTGNPKTEIQGHVEQVEAKARQKAEESRKRGKG